MAPRDRRISLVLFAVAATAWVAVVLIATTVDPFASSEAAYLGAAALGSAVASTTAPLFWLVGFARQRRIAFRGDWARAIRRGAWTGGLVGLYVIMRANGIFQPEIGLFFVALALVAEVTLSTGGRGEREPDEPRGPGAAGRRNPR